MYSLEAIERMNQQAIEKHRKEQEARIRELVKNTVKEEMVRYLVDAQSYGDAGC